MAGIAEAGAGADARTRRWTLGVVCAATALLLLDVTAVNVALPVLRDDLGASFTDLQWVVDAYALSLAVLLLPAGALADRLGRRAVLAAGIAVFAVASLACAAAWSPVVLHLARALQGAGGAAMFATSLAVLADAYPPARRGRALGLWGAISGGALALGPLVGGALVDGPGWRWIFLVNLPVGAVLLAATLRRARESRDPAAAPPDWMGAAAFSVAAFLLVGALLRGNAAGWSSAPVLGAVAGGTLALGAFCAVELRLAHPMLDLRLFRRPAFTGTAIVAFAQSFALYPMFLFLAVLFQDVDGLTPLETGIRLLPVTVALFAVAPVSGALTGRVPLRLLLGTGLALVGAGLLLMRGLAPDSHWTALLPGFVCGGIGIGVISPALAAAMVGVLPGHRAGLASGTSNLLRQLGIAVGIAVLGAVFASRVEAGTAVALPGPGGARVGRLAADGRVEEAVLALGPDRAGTAAAAVRAGFVDGLDAIFLIAGAVALAAVPAALVLLRDLDAPAGSAAR